MRVCRRVVRLALKYGVVYCIFGIFGILYLVWRCTGPFLRDEGETPP